MTYFETLNEMKDTIVLDEQHARESYLLVEKNLAEGSCKFVAEAEVTSSSYGDGKVTNVYGNTFDTIVLEITFSEMVKKFSLMHVTINTKFIKFVNEELYEPLLTALDIHNKLTATHKEYELTTKQKQKEAEKKAEVEKKAEAKYLEHKEKAIKEFDELVQQAKASLSTVDEFYYALGWLTSHVGTVAAALPDYLLNSFESHFGPDTNPRVIDSKKRTVGGFPMQWALSITASLRGKDKDAVPYILTQYLNSTGKALANTSFIWELIDNYGFRFGKKQDVDKIRQTIPAKFISSYEAGLVA